jgi:hypothetical protein
MRLRIFLTFVMSIALTAAVSAETPPADAGDRVTLERPRARVNTVVLHGHAPARARVRIVKRTSRGWVRVGSDRADRRGRYSVRVQRPARRRWVVRAALDGTRSRRRIVAPVSTNVEPVIVSPSPVDPPPTDACGVRPLKSDGTWWECSFVDEFDGDAFDPAKWVAQETWFSGMTNGKACYVKSPSTISMGNGTLRLSAVKLAKSFECQSPFGDFPTDRAVGGITTKGRFSQAYGRFEVRARMPKTRVQGAHSAIWMFPDDRKYGAWPLSGEIDIAEWYSALPRRAFPSVHYVDGGRNIHTGHDGVLADASRYHTYAVEWTPTTMRFYYDGKLTFEHAWKPLAPLLGSQPFDQPFNVVLNQAWGGLWNAPTAETPDRVTMTVDWVRVWK